MVSLVLSSSCAAVTVTVWGVPQSVVEKVSVVGLAVRSLSPVLAAVRVTLAVGWVASLTVKVAVDPSASETDSASARISGASSSTATAVTAAVRPA